MQREMATHSYILAWRIPWTKEPGRLQSTGSQRVRHDWMISLSFFLSFILRNVPIGVINCMVTVSISQVRVASLKIYQNARSFLAYCNLLQKKKKKLYFSRSHFPCTTIYFVLFCETLSHNPLTTCSSYAICSLIIFPDISWCPVLVWSLIFSCHSHIDIPFFSLHLGIMGFFFISVLN